MGLAARVRRNSDENVEKVPTPPLTLKLPALTREDFENMDSESAAVRLLLENFLEQQNRERAGKRFDNIEAKLEWDGTKIILPSDPAKMNYEEAIKWLERLRHLDEENIAVNEIVDAFPFDGAIAMMKAMKEIYGWVSPVPPQSWFEAPPTMTSVDISPTERNQIIWGRFAIPGIQGTLQTGIAYKAGRPVFSIKGDVKKKHLVAVSEIAEKTREIVARESIYRGKAVRLTVTNDGKINFDQPPAFMDVSEANPEELIFSEELTEQINTNLFTPIVHSQACRNAKIPLKRGILMEGPFGTGKTLCAFVTAGLAEDNGWTFIMVDRVAGLTAALQFGVVYQPCVIFCEDINRETSGDRTPELDNILNVVDGILSKGREIMVVLTSNEASTINQAMMRPGRLDAVLSIQPPDAHAVERLMRLYGRGLIPDDEPLGEAGSVLAGEIPAVIRECVERAKLYSISRGGNGAVIQLRESDLVRAAKGMAHHLELLNGKKTVEPSIEHQLGAAMIGNMRKLLDEKISDDLDETHAVVLKIKEHLQI